MIFLPIPKYFSQNGILSELLEGFDYNPGQERMAALVDQSLKDKEYLLVEAGTGTGKTFAYLIPAIESRKKIVVTTATKALQDQLIEKDIPFLQDTIGLRFIAVQMKGRANYLCRRRLEIFSKNPLFDAVEEAKLYHRVVNWAEKTQTGDRTELTGLPESLQFWNQINSSPDHCWGQNCPNKRQCYVTKMRAKAQDADLVIVNHHLFFADLAIRNKANAAVIPRYEAVIFDEAHQIESVATEFFGTTISNYRFEELGRDARKAFGAVNALDAGVLKAIEKMEKAARSLLAPLAKSITGNNRFKLTGKQVDDKVRKKLDLLEKALITLTAKSETIASVKDSEDSHSIAKRSLEIAEQARLVLSLEDTSMVYWCERRGKGIFATASPIDVSKDLTEKLYDQVDTLIFTSATLATSNDFSYFKKRVGITRECVEAMIPSHFDFQRQALLFLPDKMPDPRSEKFIDALTAHIQKILEASGGRAFVLFTSYRNMTLVYERLSVKSKFTCLLQGEKPKSELLVEFRRDITSVLFATMSFWQGVDVRGEALSCVIIDKIPFEVPSDPVVEARINRIQQNGGTAFFEYQVPEATIILKQGIGRLIRNRTDRGIVVICDPRLRTKGYGKTIVKSLPDFPITSDYSRLLHFFK